MRSMSMRAGIAAILLLSLATICNLPASEQPEGRPYESGPPRRMDFEGTHSLGPATAPTSTAPYVAGPPRRLDFEGRHAAPLPAEPRAAYVAGPARRLDFQGSHWQTQAAGKPAPKRSSPKSDSRTRKSIGGPP